MDWTATGISNSFEFELLDAALNHVGWLDGVTGGTITQTYRGDYRCTASLDTDGTVPPANRYVRIWNVASLGGEIVRTCLATLMPDLPGGEYRLGRWTRSIDLYSAMKKLDTTHLATDYGLAKNTAVAAKWQQLVKSNGAVPVVSSGVSTTAKTASARVYEYSTPVLSILHELAGMASGYIEVDALGRICLVPYVLPSRRGASWALESGSDSIMLVGVGLEAPEPVNRVTARYESGGKVYYAKADVAASHPWSNARINRIVAEEITDPVGSGTGWLQKLVDRELAARTSAKSLYEVTTLFHPAIQPGTVGTVSYWDSPDDGGLAFKAFCSQREITLDAAMTTTLTLEEL